jgi:hypothetical protein
MAAALVLLKSTAAAHWKLKIEINGINQPERGREKNQIYCPVMIPVCCKPPIISRSTIWWWNCRRDESDDGLSNSDCMMEDYRQPLVQMPHASSPL